MFFVLEMFVGCREAQMGIVPVLLLTAANIHKNLELEACREKEI